MGRGSEIGFESEIDSGELGAADAQLEHDHDYGTFVVRRTRCSHEASEGRAVRTKRCESCDQTRGQAIFGLHSQGSVRHALIDRDAADHAIPVMVRANQVISPFGGSNQQDMHRFS
jgi:hypothetical protein